MSNISESLNSMRIALESLTNHVRIALRNALPRPSRGWAPGEDTALMAPRGHAVAPPGLPWAHLSHPRAALGSPLGPMGFSWLQNGCGMRRLSPSKFNQHSLTDCHSQLGNLVEFGLGRVLQLPWYVLELPLGAMPLRTALLRKALT